MSGSQSKRNHRREARTRAEAPKSFMHALLPKRVGRAFALLTRTYHGCRQAGSYIEPGPRGIGGTPSSQIGYAELNDFRRTVLAAEVRNRSQRVVEAVGEISG